MPYEVLEMTLLWKSRDLSHARLHFADAALTPEILFIHGGFHGAWCWSKTLAFLAAHGVGAAALDLRGHGGLAQDASFVEQGVAQMTQDIIEAVNALQRPIFLAGHSLGALLAMKAATEHAPRGLITLSPAAPANIARTHALPRFPSARAILPPDEDRARKWFMTGSADADLSAYLSQLCPESPTLLNECFHDGVAVESGSIPCPHLCISGAKDDSPFHPAGQDDAVATHYGATLEVIRASGHCLMLDDGWKETAAAIHAWIQNN